jgi:hypothetical protein
MSTISAQEYETRIAALERQSATLAAALDGCHLMQRDLSEAYLRLRRLIGQKAFDTPHAPTGKQIWTTTEIALAGLVAEVDRQRAEIETMRPILEVVGLWRKGTRRRDGGAWVEGLMVEYWDAYEASREGADEL